jgi:tetratricopeptide (TPR) repeat protein
VAPFGAVTSEEQDRPNGPIDERADGPTNERSEAEELAALAERETAYGLFQRGRALLRRRHHAQAAVILERAARLEPHKGSIVEALGRAYYNSGQHERAAEAFEELLSIDPSAAYGHFGLGQALKQLGRRDEARTHLRLAVALAPDSPLYRDALARLGGAST